MWRDAVMRNELQGNVRDRTRRRLNLVRCEPDAEHRGQRRRPTLGIANHWLAYRDAAFLNIECETAGCAEWWSNIANRNFKLIDYGAQHLRWVVVAGVTVDW